MPVDTIKRLILRKKLHSSLLTQPLDAGDIVGGIAEDGQVIDHLLRPDAVFRLDLLLPVFGIAAAGLLRRRPEDIDMAGDKLHQVLVGGDDGSADALLPRQAGKGGDDIIGLEALPADDADADIGQRLCYQGDLRMEVLWCRRPGRLVCGIHLMAEGRMALIHGDCHIIGAILGKEHHQRGEEAIVCADIHP